MVPPLFDDWMFELAAIGTALIAGYQGVIKRKYAMSLQIGAISVLWLSVIFIDGHQDIFVSVTAIVTLILIWILTQDQVMIQ